MLEPMHSSNVFSRLDVKVGDLYRLVTEMRSSMGNLANASIGKGGIVVKDGGSIKMYDADGKLLTVIQNGRIFSLSNTTEAQAALSNAALYLTGDRTNGNDSARILVPSSGANPRTGELWITPPAKDYYENNTQIILTGDFGTTDPKSVILQSEPGNFVWVNGADKLIRLKTPSCEVVAEKLYLYQLPSTSQSANLALVVENGLPRIRLVSSSEEIKADIKKVSETDERIFELDLVSWVDKPDQNQDSDTTDPNPRRHHGTTVQALERAGLSEYVTPGSSDLDILPSVAYDRLFVPVVQGIKSERAKRVALEQKVKEQGQQIAALSARLEALEKASSS